MKEEWSSVNNEVRELEQNYKTLTSHKASLVARASTLRKETANIEQRLRSWQDIYNTKSCVTAMAKEDLLSTTFENIELNTLANQLETQMCNKQK